MKFNLLITIILSLCIQSVSYAENIPEKTVNPKQLYDLIELSDSLVVKDGPFEDSKTLFESKDKKDLSDLRNSLVIERPERGFHCMCLGEPAIYLYKNGKELALLTNHHGISVRCSLWSSDAPVIEPEKWLKWFDDRNIPGPRKEYEEMKAQEEKSKKSWDRWITAMPKEIKPHWEKAIGQFGMVNIGPLVEVLENEMPDKTQRILVLLEWFGSGAGPWSGFPSYESAAEEMLLKYTTSDILAAIKATNLTLAQTEGTARFFGGFSFSKKHPNGLTELPDAIKKMLWNHVKSTKDKDKFERAESAFN